MRLVVSSEVDEASINIRDRLLERNGWEPKGERLWSRGDVLLTTLTEHHLHVDNVDERLREDLPGVPEVVVYVSKHRAGSGRNSLTVHPIGNWGVAEYGGRPGQVVPAAPGPMTEALRDVATSSRGMGYEATFEATHHGPYLERPTFYIEVGTGPPAWADHRAAAVLSEAVLSAGDPGFPVALGFGGGHYAPRITDVALARKVSFGHIVPSYALDPPNLEAIASAIDRTPGASLAYFHRKAIPTPRLREIEAFCRDRGLEVVREGDLEPLPPSETL